MTFGRLLRQLREEKGLRQADVANALGVTNQAVSKWESAQCCPDIQLLPLISDYFEVSIDELMGHNAVVQKQKIGFVIDGLADKALVILNEEGQISTAILQRHLNIGYSKAKNLIRQLEENEYIESSGKWNYVLKK